MGEALDRVALSMAQVAAYTKKVNGKSVHVRAHFRAVQTMTTGDLLKEMADSQGKSDMVSKNRLRQVTNELRTREMNSGTKKTDRSSFDLLKGQSHARADVEGELVDPEMYPHYRDYDDWEKYDNEWSDDYDWGRENAEDDYDGFRSYTDTGHYMMNRALRGVEMSEEDRLQQTGDLERMDRFFAARRREFDKNTRLYRWFDPAPGFKPETWRVGNQITDKGWLSTTLASESADAFGEWRIELLAPKGTEYLPGEVGEKELILRRGTSFQVTYIDRINKVVEAVVL